MTVAIEPELQERIDRAARLHHCRICEYSSYEVEAVEKPHENCIDTLCRVAGLPPWNPKTHPPFSDKAREYFSAIV